MKRQERHKRHYTTWILAGLLVVALVWVGYSGHEKWSEPVDDDYYEFQAITQLSEKPCLHVKYDSTRWLCRRSVDYAKQWSTKSVFPVIKKGQFVLGPVYVNVDDAIGKTPSSVWAVYSLFDESFKKRLPKLEPNLISVSFTGTDTLQPEQLKLSNCTQYVTSSHANLVDEYIKCCIDLNCETYVFVHGAPRFKGVDSVTFKQPEPPSNLKDWDYLSDLMSAINATLESKQAEK